MCVREREKEREGPQKGLFSCARMYVRERERELFLNGENVWFEECVTSPLPSLFN